MKTEKEIREEIKDIERYVNANKLSLGKNSLDYWDRRIMSLEWVLED